jgi:hypothetical protein
MCSLDNCGLEGAPHSDSDPELASAPPRSQGSSAASPQGEVGAGAEGRAGLVTPLQAGNMFDGEFGSGGELLCSLAAVPEVAGPGLRGGATSGDGNGGESEFPDLDDDDIFLTMALPGGQLTQFPAQKSLIWRLL